jgi:hypothetical protein
MVHPVNVLTVLNRMDIPNCKSLLFRVNPVIPDLVGIKNMTVQLYGFFRCFVWVFIKNIPQSLIEMMIVFQQFFKE